LALKYDPQSAEALANLGALDAQRASSPGGTIAALAVENNSSSAELIATSDWCLLPGAITRVLRTRSSGACRYRLETGLLGFP